MDITINPTPSLVITNPADVCFPETVDLTDPTVTAGSTGNGLLTYWTSLNPLTLLPLPTSVSTSGTYFIQSTTLQGCSNVQDGTYTWKIEFKTKLNGQRKILVGHVNLLK